jgi:hypothetical protein
MRWWWAALGLVVASVAGAGSGAAQTLPPGGVYADGAYYVPGDPAAFAAPTWPNPRSPCWSGDYLVRGIVPSVYVAYSATFVRIAQVWPANGGGTHLGFPYLPVYPYGPGC